MQQLIQHIIFPDDPSLELARELFYRGDHGRLSDLSGKGHLYLGKRQFVEFGTYLNGLSFRKWKKYTPLQKIALVLNYAGEAEITLIGYHLEQGCAQRSVLLRQIICTDEHGRIELVFPDNDETILGFEISAITDFELLGGYYLGEFPEESERQIELALLTTTYKREAFIKKNAVRIKEGLFDIYPDLEQHIHMHIVDNGRTLSKADFPDDPEHFILHPNPNAGGAGGYARGMIECLHQKPTATHGLLMDDDIMILPESIYRTYQLLTFMKPEFQDYMISGAMMLMEDKMIQHEDMGTVTPEGYFKAVKSRLNQKRILSNLKNEEEYQVWDVYQAWWYCCIPVNVIKQNGLPLPLFIRGDDVEYGLRCNAKIISMNGICLWHMGFDGKFSATMNIYQEIRNLMIDQATTGVLQDRNYLDRIQHIYRECLLKHDYTSCEFVLNAWEDFMKGPEFIMEDRGEEIMKKNAKASDKMVPYTEIMVSGFNSEDDPYREEPRKPLKKWLYRLTWNGVYCPDAMLDKKPVNIPVDLTYFPGKMAMKKTYIAMDIINKKACVRELDKARFKKCQKRYKKDKAYYLKNREAIERAYAEKREYLTSEAFWRKYLRLDAQE